MNWALPWLIFEVIICVLVLTMSRENPRYVDPIEFKAFLDSNSLYSNIGLCGNKWIGNFIYKTSLIDTTEMLHQLKIWGISLGDNSNIRWIQQETIVQNNKEYCHESRKRHLRRPHFSKGLTKLAILPDYKCPGLICLALPARRKVRKLDFQSEFSKSKSFRIFFSLKNNRLGAHFLLRWFFYNFNRKNFITKITPNFWRAGKARQINPGHL